jgi:peptidylamidoglycolate lyase
LGEGFAFGQVSGVAVDSHNHVFVFHRSDHRLGPAPTKNDQPIDVPTIFCFEAETGKLVTSWGANIFPVPHGLRIDREDNIWVTDIALHQVLKFNHDGQLLMTVGAKGTPGLDGKHFDKPTDVAIAPDGSFYVSDGYGNSRVAKFSPSGEFLFDWGRKGDKPGEFNTPHGIAIDAQGRIYVADRTNSRVQVFKGDGTFLYQWKNAELGRPWALTVGPDNYLYVVDGGDLKLRPPDRSHILKLDLQGNIVEKWASFGSYDGQLYWGHAIAVGRNRDVYVGDILGMRAQKFSESAFAGH